MKSFTITDVADVYTRRNSGTFIDSYCRTFSPFKAAHQAGVLPGESIEAAATRYLSLTENVQAITERSKALTLSANVIAAQLSQMATVTLADLGRENEDGVWDLDLASAAKDGVLSAVKKYTIDRYGKVVIDFYDRLDIFTMLLRLQNLDLSTRGPLAGSGSGNGEGSAGGPDNMDFEDIIQARKSAAQYEQQIIDGEGDNADGSLSESD